MSELDGAAPKRRRSNASVREPRLAVGDNLDRDRCLFGQGSNRRLIRRRPRSRFLLSPESYYERILGGKISGTDDDDDKLQHVFQQAPVGKTVDPRLRSPTTEDSVEAVEDSSTGILDTSEAEDTGVLIEAPTSEVIPSEDDSFTDINEPSYTGIFNATNHFGIEEVEGAVTDVQYGTQRLSQLEKQHMLQAKQNLKIQMGKNK